MKKRLMFAAMVALAMLVIVTPVLAAGSGSQNGELEQNQGETQSQEHNQIGSGQQNGELEQNQGTTQNQEQNKIGPADSADAILGEVLSANRFVMSLVESVLGLLG